MSVFKCTVIWYKLFNKIQKTQKTSSFFAFFGVSVFWVSCNFDLSGLLSSSDKKPLKNVKKHSVRFNLMLFESNCNKLLSKNWWKYHLQYLQFTLCPENFLRGHVVVPPGENLSFFATFFSLFNLKCKKLRS